MRELFRDEAVLRDASRVVRRLLPPLAVVGAMLVQLPAPSAEPALAYEALRAGDYATAYTDFAAASEDGDADAALHLGWLYAEGLGVVADQTKAFFWYQRAAGLGHVEAQTIVALRYASGLGVGRDDALAEQWFAASRGDSVVTPQSAADSVVEPFVGARIPLRSNMPFLLRTRGLAEGGDPGAQYLLALRYALGEGVGADSTRALYWLREAAENGLAPAQHGLGLRYALGDGIAQSDERAAHWYRAAAERGHAESQYLLAVSLLQGHGVAQDRDEGIVWLEKAAANGHSSAQRDLGLAYASGESTDEDLVQAYLWLSLAAEQGDEFAQRNREATAQRMRPSQLADANHRVRGFLENGL